MSRNVAASVRARLKNHADQNQQDFNLTLTRYGLERLLYRLSVSPHSPNFLLKGALLFSLWYNTPHRPTRDADLLGFGPDDIPSAVAVFRQVCAVEVEDGVEFDPTSVKGEEIRKDAGYGGVRIDLRATLDGARIALQVDIGYGDVVTPGPVQVSYPVMLDDLPAPQLRAYPKYTVVAEKFEALCKLGMANSRMKDYFDLWVLLREGDLDPKQLRLAIKATFAQRRTALPVALPVGLSSAFVEDPSKNMQWTAFLKKNRIEGATLGDVVAVIGKRILETGLK